MTDRPTRLVALLNRYAHLQQPISLRYVADLLRQERFTGPVTFHYVGGIPRRIEAGRPLTVELAPAPVDSSLRETSENPLTADKT